jgi:hypothetical protein
MRERQRRRIRLSAAVSSKFLPLYHFFASHHQHFIPYFFISRSGFPYILPLYPTITIKYHYPILFIIITIFSSPIKKQPYKCTVEGGRRTHAHCSVLLFTSAAWGAF